MLLCLIHFVRLRIMRFEHANLTCIYTTTCTSTNIVAVRPRYLYLYMYFYIYIRGQAFRPLKVIYKIKGQDFTNGKILTYE